MLAEQDRAIATKGETRQLRSQSPLSCPAFFCFNQRMQFYILPFHPHKDRPARSIDSQKTSACHIFEDSLRLKSLMIGKIDPTGRKGWVA
jgi:hypothetical protein